MTNGIGRVGWRNYVAPLTSSIITSGLALNLDAGNTLSYSGTGTTWTDLSGNNRNGTLTNGTSYSSINGGTLVFDGVNDDVRIANLAAILNSTSNFSLDMWFRVSNPSSTSNSLFSYGESYEFNKDILLYVINSKLGIQVNSPFVDGGMDGAGEVNYTSTSFSNVQVVYNGTLTGNSNRLKLYLNGIEQTLTYNYTVPYITGAVGGQNAIGSYAVTGFRNLFLNGNISIARLYNRSLTSTEVLQNFDATKTRFGFTNYTTRTAAFATATGITDTTILNALNTFDTGLISNGLDTKMKALYPFVGGTANTHKFNFMDARDVNAAYRLQFNGGFVHSSTGALPNGTNGYANTFLNTTTNLTLLSHSFGVYSRTNSTATDMCYGNYDGGSSILAQNFKGNFISGPVASGVVTYTANPSTRMMIGSRISGFFSAYRNNTLLGTVGLGIANLPNNDFYLFGRNQAGGGALLFSNHELAFAFLGDGLTSTDVTNFTNLVNTLQTSLSRQV